MHPQAPILPPPGKTKRRKSIMLRFLGFAFAAGGILFIVGAAVAAYFLWQISRELPDYEKLTNYEPAVMTRVHAGDGSLIGEFARERRIYLPISAIPKKVINAFISAEDQNFYQHNGLDFQGIVRALKTNFENMGRGKRPEGASTITQQVAKNFLLSSDVSVTRKLKEAILAVRIDRAFPKEKILELYLNEIYLGMGSYGVAAASLNYFGKELQDLEIEEAAYLAALPKAPNNYHPFRFPERATARRNWVIQRLADDGHITQDEAKKAQAKPFTITQRPFGGSQFAAEYFAEEVRRTLIDLYGEDNLYGGGLSVRSTLDPQMQKLARKAMREGLVRYDRKQGYRGPVKRLALDADWGAQLAEIDVIADLAPWELGIVLQAGADRAVVGIRPPKSASGKVEKERKTVELPLKNVSWARKADPAARNGGTAKLGKKPKTVSEVLAPGDIIYVAPKEEISKDAEDDEKEDAGTADGWRLVQIPEVEGAMVVMDPHTGRVLAVVGGFSYASSQFDRAIQAKRQPGSSFKPIVYAAALDNGYTPSSIVLDAPLAIDQGVGKDIWKPENYENKFYGPSTLRLGLEKSRNLMTVRLAQDLGMPLISEYSRRFGVYDQLMPLLSMALGAGETTLLRLTTAYCAFANGGKQVQASMIDRIQDRFGKTIWRHDNRECPACDAQDWHGQSEPGLTDTRKQIVDPHTAYQITSMLEGVVKRGTGYRVSKVGKPLAGKTGTTNDEKDAWFVGFSPDLVAGIFVGFDNPRPMGKGETGGGIAAPIFRDFMRAALDDKPATPFRVPPGIKLVRIDAKTGMRAQQGTEKTILEAYKPNEDPPDPFSYVTYPGADTQPQQQPDGGGVSVGGSFSRQPQAGGLY
jgi:penicillin-binding protein 1A